MKTSIIKRTMSMLLALALCLSAIPFSILTVSASATWPSLSASRYCEMIAFSDIPVYRYTSLSTRGTCSPAKSYNAYVEKGDKLYIFQITANYTKLSYPVSGGSRRTGYVKTSTLFGVTAPSEIVTSKIKMTTYTSNSTSVKSGSIAAGDTVYKLGTTKNGFVLVIYDAVSGKRACKAAFCTKSDYAKTAVKTAPNNTTQTASAVQNRLDAIGNGSLRYNNTTVMKIGAKFSGTRSGEQCKGYAKNVFYMCFGITPGSTQPRNKGLNYLIYDTKGMTKLGSVTNMNESAIRNLFANARHADFVQIRRSHGGSHSAIVYSVSSTGVTFLEANLDGQNTVYLRSYTWSQLCQQNAAMSVYTATNYKLK